jgi:Na+/H+ antiporter NhaC
MSETSVMNAAPPAVSSMNNLRRITLEYIAIVIGFLAITILSPDDVTSFGVLSAIPSIFLLAFIFYTKRVLEGLTLASLLGFLMAGKLTFFSQINTTLTTVLTDGNTQWLFIVCGLMGSIIALVERSGGADAFGRWVAKRAKTRKSTMLWTWILGVVIFIDDYLNSLTVGACMAPITDKHRVSREKLAYIVDSTAAPVCVLIPISTWAVYIGSLLEQSGAAAEGEGVKFFIKTIPFNFYGWIAALIVPLVILGIIPLFGPMKKAEKRAREEGILASPMSLCPWARTCPFVWII